MRPLEGILPHDEILGLDEIRQKGGFVSMRRMEDGSESPYELNSTYFSALSDPENEEMGMAVPMLTGSRPCDEGYSGGLFPFSVWHAQ